MPERLSPLYLTDAEVDALAPSPGALADAIAAAFLARARGTATAPAKTAMTAPGSDLYCQAMPAAIAGIAAGVKWVALSPGNPARGLAHISATMILADPETGVLAGILEAGRLTALRTAAVSLLAARYLVRPNAAVLALVGCGVQARAHLEALRSEFPIGTVRVLGRRRASAEAFARDCGGAMLDLVAVESPDAALRETDVVVSTVPAQRDLVAFLDAGQLPAGASALMVDLARSWIPDSLAAFDRHYTDDAVQSRALASGNPSFEALQFSADLAGLVSGRAVGRRARDERLCFAFAGSGIADVAVAALLLNRARAAGRGIALPTSA
jgi:ornithine cyclodeaminase/alanine dehydrogenase